MATQSCVDIPYKRIIKSDHKKGEKKILLHSLTSDYVGNV
jgi:hypothetical protein